MERCCGSVDQSNFEKELFEGMKKLHSLRIVHRDIKPANVDWSPHFKKWVFIDFGFAAMLEEETGCKTKTKFIGSYPYASRELQKTHDLRTFGQVDFYYNDLHGLRKVIKAMKETEDKEKEKRKEAMIEISLDGEKIEIEGTPDYEPLDFFGTY